MVAGAAGSTNATVRGAAACRACHTLVTTTPPNAPATTQSRM